MSDDALIASLRRLKLVGINEVVSLSPLTGGVSSDIHLVETPTRRFCVKRALARLKVAALWEAPLERNSAEAAWMREVGTILPTAVPEILGEDEQLGMFAMAFLPPAEYPVWKAQLLSQRVDVAFAARVGEDLGLIHARTARDPSIGARFANDATFVPIRIEPYLLATGRAHPDLALRFETLASATLANKRVLAHGDVSPKNILSGRSGPIFLDAECACHGDPAFDLAFCLNHLLLKGARKNVDRKPYRRAFVALTKAYLDKVDWEARTGLEARAAALLPALFLARVDGKSPVEYLNSGEEREAVRRFAVPLVANPPANLVAIANDWTAL
jgi:aminoglycoside phosphotransferase (APT) family kinase protein